jgi:hypothetical protein
MRLEKKYAHIWNPENFRFFNIRSTKFKLNHFLLIKVSHQFQDIYWLNIRSTQHVMKGKILQI